VGDLLNYAGQGPVAINTTITACAAAGERLLLSLYLGLLLAPLALAAGGGSGDALLCSTGAKQLLPRIRDGRSG